MRPGASDRWRLLCSGTADSKPKMQCAVAPSHVGRISASVRARPACTQTTSGYAAPETDRPARGARGSHAAFSSVGYRKPARATRPTVARADCRRWKRRPNPSHCCLCRSGAAWPAQDWRNRLPCRIASRWRMGRCGSRRVQAGGFPVPPRRAPRPTNSTPSRIRRTTCRFRRNRIRSILTGASWSPPRAASQAAGRGTAAGSPS